MIIMVVSCILKILLQGRTIGEIYREDVQIDGVYSGLKDEEILKACPVIGSCDEGIKFDIFDDRPTTFSEQIPGFVPEKFLVFFNAKESRKAEVSSSNICANARGCAKLASIMANKGQGLMSEQSWEELHSEPSLQMCNGE